MNQIITLSHQPFHQKNFSPMITNRMHYYSVLSLLLLLPSSLSDVEMKKKLESSMPTSTSMRQISSSGSQHTSILSLLSRITCFVFEKFFSQMDNLQNQKITKLFVEIYSFLSRYSVMHSYVLENEVVIYIISLLDCPVQEVRISSLSFIHTFLISSKNQSAVNESLRSLLMDLDLLSKLKGILRSLSNEAKEEQERILSNSIVNLLNKTKFDK
ncbi:uncharacterized protein MONOS_18544 [Monocercomonoides exilis]|uniref:uncharacterized protein n=1 Tax=Monocercomonoides exilis TaxID=2049356 RepID=UPI0035593856|nr:hypothetical protein MONOS_18544 [Monocercomonoides exilis]